MMVKLGPKHVAFFTLMNLCIRCVLTEYITHCIIKHSSYQNCVENIMEIMNSVRGLFYLY
jgi:hypothetical protein